MNTRQEQFPLFQAIALGCLSLLTATSYAGPGLLDSTFAPIFDGPVYSAAVQPDGRILIAGNFTKVNGVTRNRLARLYADGSLDASFMASGSGISGAIFCLSVQKDGLIIIGGDITLVNGTARTRVARLNPNGSVDGSFVPTNTISGSVLTLVAKSDNKLIIGGSFAGANFPKWNARLNADGTLDTAFSSYPNGAVNTMAIQTDGKTVIGGAFTTVNGAPRNRIARLNPDGSLDNSFQNGLAGASGLVRCLQIQADGKILIGGDFTTVNSTARGSIARLNSNGSLDTGFASSASANGPVYAMVVQPDNSMVIAGGFSAYAGYNLSRVARLYGDGTCDTAFSTFGINNLVQALAVQSDGAILTGGTFTSINTTNRSFLGRLYGDLYPPEFVSQPASRATNVGATVTFTVRVSNPTPSEFQWRKDGNNISGATGMSYTLYGVQFADAGIYSVFVHNAVGGIASSNAVLNVGIAPAITGQPVSLIVTQGQSATFAVVATGTPLNYFWKKDGSFITGATNSSYTIANVAASNAATYACQVSNFLGSVTSTGATLTVYSPPAIKVQPISQTVGVGSNFTVSVTATGNPAPTCQWSKDGTDILGATNSNYTVTGAQTNNTGGYSLVLSNIFGVVTSSVANISVLYYAPTITAQPVGTTLLVGSNFTLTVTATGTAPLAYQWRKDGENLSGANGTSFTVTAAQTNDTGAYTVVVTNVAGSRTSSVAIVNVGYAPLIVQQPQPFTNNLGTSNAFSVVVSGSAPLVYQWFKDGMIIAGATNSLLPLSNLQSNQVGYYAVTVTNHYGWSTSSNALLSIPGVPFRPWLSQGLVAYYPFNGNANDSIDTNHGTVHGAALAQDRFGNINQAYSFNGTNAYIEIPPSTNVFGSRDYTVSMWFNSARYPDSNDHDHDAAMLISKGRNTCELHLGCPQYSNKGIRFLPRQENGFSWVADARSADFHINFWYHLVATWREADHTFHVFLNGQELALTSVGGPDVPDNTSPARLGMRYNGPGGTNSPSVSGGGGIPFQGSLDDIRIYNRALTTNEVAQLYAFEADIPAITLQPQNQTVSQGGTATFSVAATAANPLNYQWFKDGVALTGFTNANLTLTNVQPGQIGFYSVAVSNAVTGVVSSNAALSVSGQDFALWQGLVAYYPFNGNANDESGTGNNGIVVGASLGTNRLGSVANSYRFTKVGDYVLTSNSAGFPIGTNDFSVSIWAWLSSFSGNVLCVNQSMGDFQLRLAGSITGSTFFLDFQTGGGGRSGSYSDYCATMPLEWALYRWYNIQVVRSSNILTLYRDGTAVAQVAMTRGNEAPPAARTLSFGLRVQDNTHQFYGQLDDIRIYNRALTTTELSQLYAIEADMPIITSQPQSTIMTQGRPVSFGVTASAQTPITYQWNKDGFPISAATNATLLIPNVQPSQAGLYTVAISNGLTGVVSAQAALAVMSSSGAGAPGFTSNQFGFGISGAAGTGFVVETSTNLQSWLPLGTNTYGTSLFQFVDPSSVTNPMRFYRVR